MAPEPEMVRRKLPGGVTVWAQRKYLDALLKAGISRPLEFIHCGKGDVIDDVAKSSITSVTLDLNGEQMRLAAKEYLPRGGWSALKNFFRASKALVELRLSAKLLALGVAVPEPVAAVEIRSLRVLRNSYLFTGEIVDGASLLELMDAQEHQNLSRSQLNTVIDALAAAVADAHGKGVFHGDLNASHLILRRWKEPGPEVFLIDFENTKLRDLTGREERVRDIGRLERSASYFLPARERLRFLKSYISRSASRQSLADWIDGVKADVARRAR